MFGHSCASAVHDLILNRMHHYLEVVDMCDVGKRERDEALMRQGEERVDLMNERDEGVERSC